MARKRLNGKTVEQQAEKTVKLTLTVPGDLARRFGVHAEMSGLTKGELFAELIRNGCKRWVVQDRNPNGAGESVQAETDIVA